MVSHGRGDVFRAIAPDTRYCTYTALELPLLPLPGRSHGNSWSYGAALAGIAMVK